MHILLPTILAVIVAIIASQPTNASIQSQRLEDTLFLYYAPFTWEVTEDGEEYWRSKYDALGMIDLRTIPQMSTPGAFDGDEQCCALISSAVAIPELDVEFISQGVNGITPRGERADIELFRVLTEDADATGQLRNKPLIPNRNGVVEAWIAPGTRLFLTSLSRDSIAWSSAMEVHRLDYDRIRRESGVEIARKVAGYWQLKYGEDIRTADQQRDGITSPETIIGDTFVEAVNTDLASHIATGPNGGFSWTELTNGFTVIGASDTVLGDSVVAENVARADSALSTDDHYAQIDRTSGSGATSFVSGIIRKANTATLTYYTNLYRSGVTWSLIKIIANVQTVLDDDATPPSGNGLVYIEANASTITGTFSGGGDILTASDTSITGNLYTGMRFFRAGEGDNFQAEDLPIPLSHRIFITHQ